MGRSPTNTKQKIIDTASELIWKNSFSATSVDDICRAADVKKGSFYHYFPSKVSLALASLEEHFQHLRPFMDEIFSPARPPLERYEIYVEEIYNKQAEIAEKYGRVCGCPFASIGSEMAGQDQEIIAKIEELHQKHQRYHENALRDMVDENILPSNTDIQSMACKLQAYTMGLMMMARIQNDLSFVKRDLKNGLFSILNIKEKSLETQK